MNDPTATDPMVSVSQAIREALGAAHLDEVSTETLYAVHRIVWAWDTDLAMEIRRRSAHEAGVSRVNEVLAESRPERMTP